jgi:hypothetical protein
MENCGAQMLEAWGLCQGGEASPAGNDTEGTCEHLTTFLYLEKKIIYLTNLHCWFYALIDGCVDARLQAAVWCQAGK